MRIYGKYLKRDINHLETLNRLPQVKRFGDGFNDKKRFLPRNQYLMQPRHCPISAHLCTVNARNHTQTRHADEWSMRIIIIRYIELQRLVFPFVVSGNFPLRGVTPHQSDKVIVIITQIHQDTILPTPVFGQFSI